VVHAPTSPSIKGTPIIEEALGRLGDRYDFEYRRVIGLPHEEALKVYAQADLVIDQVLSGWYGGLAVEVMAMGKPVVAFLREQDLGVIPSAMRQELPILRVDPRRIDDDLSAIFECRAQWPQVGARSRRFVERWHNPDRIARALARIYRDPRAPLSY
jgi:glycosyltransferase involved in cell wall biosynthesis